MLERPKRAVFELLYWSAALKAIVRCVGVLLRGEDCQLALEATERRKPLQGQRLVTMM
jgi:hypothetical protein